MKTRPSYSYPNSPSLAPRRVGAMLAALLSLGLPALMPGARAQSADAAPPSAPRVVLARAEALDAPEPPEPPDRENASFERTVERSVNAAMRSAEAAIARAAEMGKSVAMRFSSSGRPATLVLPGEDLEVEAADALSEDLAVMGRILGKAAGRGGSDQHLWMTGFGGFGSPGLEALYLDGFGALFLLNVDFPLVGPKDTKKSAQAEPVDRTWEEARRELKSGRGPFEAAPTVFLGRGDEGADFEPGRVEELKRALIESLRHAANLKSVRENDTIAVAVFGPAPKLGGGGGGSNPLGAHPV